MRSSDFTATAAGRIIAARAPGLGQYEAFVPFPLPPRLDWTAALARSVSDATLSLGRLAGVGERLANPHLLIRPFIRREAVLSSRIEGTQASLSDLFFFEAAPSAAPAIPDVREVANHVAALEYGLAESRRLPLGVRLLRGMHERLLDGVRGADQEPGELRDVQNWIGPAGSGLRDATYVPPPPAEMIEALSSLEKYIHERSDLPPLARLAMIHYQFEALHPFRDGNGRIGRLLITLILCLDGLLPQPLLYLSAFFERHRGEYYDRLLAVSQRGEWSAWLEFFLRGVAEQAADAVARAARLDALRAGYHRRLQSARASALLLKLVDELFGTPMISVGQAARLLGVTPRSAQLSIDKLAAAGIVRESTGRQRNRVFVAGEILRAVDSPATAVGSSTDGEPDVTSS